VTQTQQRRPTTGAPTNTTTPDSVTPANDIPRARGHGIPPSAGRKFWAIVVLLCPWCSSGHIHRTGMTARLLAGRLTKVCPVAGRPYVVAPVTRRREARRPVRHHHTRANPTGNRP
jgi:hypothetical protein